LKVTAADGVALHVLLTAPRAPVGVLVLCHGLTESCHEHGAFPKLRDRGLRAGLAVVRFDFRAHGSSGGTNEQFRLAGVRMDMDAVLALIDEQLGPDLPLIPVGVSFGGAAAVHAARTASAVGLVLWYAVIDYEWNYGRDSTVPLTRLMRASAGPADPAWSEMPVLSTGFYMPAALLAEARNDRTTEHLRALTVPVLSYHGGRDTFVDPAPLRRIAAERPNVTARMLPGAGHGFLLWRPWVIRSTVSFAARLARRAALAPGGAVAQAVSPPSTTST
jgi:pimeloyl-ACP methyl ester carboxylesterase